MLKKMKMWLRRFVYDHPIECYWDASDTEIGHADYEHILEDYSSGDIVEIHAVAIIKTFKVKVR